MEEEIEKSGGGRKRERVGRRIAHCFISVRGQHLIFLPSKCGHLITHTLKMTYVVRITGWALIRNVFLYRPWRFCGCR
jgi:hypothetical protein